MDEGTTEGVASGAGMMEIEGNEEGVHTERVVPEN